MKKAFTLSEILITLGIIGIVAALTIPVIMNKKDNAELASSFLKEYSVLTNAWSQIITENGGFPAGVYSSANLALDAICTKVKCIKKCYDGNDKTACKAPDSEVKSLDRVSATWMSLSGAIAVLADGSTFSLQWWYPNCDYLRNNNTTCSYLIFDTNGKRKPNIIGRDIFELWLTQQNIVATGAERVTGTYRPDDQCKPSVTTLPYNGGTCGAKILLDRAMNY